MRIVDATASYDEFGVYWGPEVGGDCKDEVSSSFTRDDDEDPSEFVPYREDSPEPVRSRTRKNLAQTLVCLAIIFIAAVAALTIGTVLIVSGQGDFNTTIISLPAALAAGEETSTNTFTLSAADILRATLVVVCVYVVKFLWEKCVAVGAAAVQVHANTQASLAAFQATAQQLQASAAALAQAIPQIQATALQVQQTAAVAANAAQQVQQTAAAAANAVPQVQQAANEFKAAAPKVAAGVLLGGAGAAAAGAAVAAKMSLAQAMVPTALATAAAVGEAVADGEQPQLALGGAVSFIANQTLGMMCANNEKYAKQARDFTAGRTFAHNLQYDARQAVRRGVPKDFRGVKPLRITEVKEPEAQAARMKPAKGERAAPEEEDEGVEDPGSDIEDADNGSVPIAQAHARIMAYACDKCGKSAEVLELSEKDVAEAHLHDIITKVLTPFGSATGTGDVRRAFVAVLANCPPGEEPHLSGSGLAYRVATEDAKLQEAFGFESWKGRAQGAGAAMINKSCAEAKVTVRPVNHVQGDEEKCKECVASKDRVPGTHPYFMAPGRGLYLAARCIGSSSGKAHLSVELKQPARLDMESKQPMLTTLSCAVPPNERMLQRMDFINMGLTCNKNYGFDRPHFLTTRVLAGEKSTTVWDSLKYATGVVPKATKAAREDEERFIAAVAHEFGSRAVAVKCCDQCNLYGCKALWSSKFSKGTGRRFTKEIRSFAGIEGVYWWSATATNQVFTTALEAPIETAAIIIGGGAAVYGLYKFVSELKMLKKVSLWAKGKYYGPEAVAAIEEKAAEEKKERDKAERKRLEDAHDAATHNREAIGKSDEAGCFSCVSVFKSSAVKEWVDESRTALCPNCKVDSVIGSVSGLPVTKEFLKAANVHWFGEEPKTNAKPEAQGLAVSKPEAVEAQGPAPKEVCRGCMAKWLAANKQGPEPTKRVLVGRKCRPCFNAKGADKAAPPAAAQGLSKNQRKANSFHNPVGKVCLSQIDRDGLKKRGEDKWMYVNGLLLSRWKQFYAPTTWALYKPHIIEVSNTVEPKMARDAEDVGGYVKRIYKVNLLHVPYLCPKQVGLNCKFEHPKTLTEAMVIKDFVPAPQPQPAPAPQVPTPVQGDQKDKPPEAQARSVVPPPKPITKEMVCPRPSCGAPAKYDQQGRPSCSKCSWAAQPGLYRCGLHATNGCNGITVQQGTACPHCADQMAQARLQAESQGLADAILVGAAKVAIGTAIDVCTKSYMNSVSNLAADYVEPSPTEKRLDSILKEMVRLTDSVALLRGKVETHDAKLAEPHMLGVGKDQRGKKALRQAGNVLQRAAEEEQGGDTFDLAFEIREADDLVREALADYEAEFKRDKRGWKAYAGLPDEEFQDLDVDFVEEARGWHESHGSDGKKHALKLASPYENDVRPNASKRVHLIVNSKMVPYHFSGLNDPALHFFINRYKYAGNIDVEQYAGKPVYWRVVREVMTRVQPRTEKDRSLHISDLVHAIIRNKDKASGVAQGTSLANPPAKVLGVKNSGIIQGWGRYPVAGEYFIQKLKVRCGDKTALVDHIVTNKHNVVDAKTGKGVVQETLISLPGSKTTVIGMPKSKCYPQREDSEHWMYQGGWAIHKTLDIAVHPIDVKKLGGAYSVDTTAKAKNGEVLRAIMWQQADEWRTETNPVPVHGLFKGYVDIDVRAQLVKGDEPRPLGIHTMGQIDRFHCHNGNSGARIYNSEGHTVGVHAAGNKDTDSDGFFVPIQAVEESALELDASNLGAPGKTMTTAHKTSGASSGVPEARAHPNSNTQLSSGPTLGAASGQGGAIEQKRSTERTSPLSGWRQSLKGVRQLEKLPTLEEEEDVQPSLIEDSDDETQETGSSALAARRL